MTKDDIISQLELLAKLIHLHDDDSFKARAYEMAASQLERAQVDLEAVTTDVIQQVLNKGMADKVVVVVQSGEFPELKKYLEMTPTGVLDLLSVNGLGPKKVRDLWKEHSIDSIAALTVLVEEGRLANIKGFGEKSAEGIKEALAQKQESVKAWHYNEATKQSLKIVTWLLAHGIISTANQWDWVGEFARKMPVVSQLDLLVVKPLDELFEALQQLPSVNESGVMNLKLDFDMVSFEFEGWPVIVYPCKVEEWSGRLLRLTATNQHLSATGTAGQTLFEASYRDCPSIQSIYESAGLPFIITEMREGRDEFDWARKYSNDEIVTWQDLKGALHNHSTYSDGSHSIEQMAIASKELGLAYFGIADHSQAAKFYANGMLPETLPIQWKEIETLNQTLVGVKVFKGIESDILPNGDLDYDLDLLQQFDYVVASVHSNLKMNQLEATKRLVTAISHPATTILGHPTGRLLLKRKGYPIDAKEVINACAAYQVAIEVNAHPWRLDLDWQWIYYAMESGVLISINPDAHHVNGLTDMHFGIAAARKAGLVKSKTLNAKSVDEIESYFNLRKQAKGLA